MLPIPVFTQGRFLGEPLLTIKYPTPRPKTPTLPPPLHRARREEEVPFLEAAYQARMAEDRVLHEEQQVAFLASHRTAWEVDVVEKQRLAVMLDEKAAFQVRAQGMPYRGGGRLQALGKMHVLANMPVGKAVLQVAIA